FAFAHAGLGGDGRDALLGEDPDIQPAAAFDGVAGHDATPLEGLGAGPAPLPRLQTGIAPGHVVAPGGGTSFAAFWAFSVLDSLGHQTHRRPPSSNSRLG